MKYSDDQLVASLKEGEEGALVEIYNRYWNKLLAIGYNHSHNKEMAEEIVQDVFISLWRRRNDIAVNHLQAFLATAVKFSVFKALAKENRRREILSEHYTVPAFIIDETTVEAKLLKEFLDNVVAGLPEKCRLVFQYSREHHLTTKEIAETMQLSPKTVESHLTRALKTLRRYFSALKIFFFTGFFFLLDLFS